MLRIVPSRSHRLSAAGMVCCAAFLSGCGSGMGAMSEPAGEPYLTGPIESIAHRATASGILVQPADSSRIACGISARVDRDTRFFHRSSDGTLRELAIGELQAGDTVEVYVTGPIAESCPVQGYASTMVLIGQSR